MINFDEIVEERCNKKRKTLLTIKDKEYSSNGNRFHNFDVAARILDTTPEKALLGMWMKHIVSVFDMIEWVETQPERITPELIDEKLGDLDCYNTLLEGLLKRRLQ